MAVKNKHTLGCHEFFIDTDEKKKPTLAIIMEKASSNLKDYLKDLSRPIPEYEVLWILKQICLGIKHLHEDLQITHRDLKPENILVMKDNNIVISDFGVAKIIDKDKLLISTKGNMRYASPEVYQFERREKLTPFNQDIYSIGMIACDIVAEILPYKKEVEEKTIEFYDGYSEKLKELIYFMLTIDPLYRPTISKVLASEIWLKL